MHKIFKPLGPRLAVFASLALGAALAGGLLPAAAAASQDPVSAAPAALKSGDFPRFFRYPLALGL